MWEWSGAEVNIGLRIFSCRCPVELIYPNTSAVDVLSIVTFDLRNVAAKNLSICVFRRFRIREYSF